MHVSKFIGNDANVYTIEKFLEFFNLANQNFKQNNLDKNIKSLHGDATKIIPDLPNNFFDFIYVDGDKGNYALISKLAEDKLTKMELLPLTMFSLMEML